jgi:hypothetical protein
VTDQRMNSRRRSSVMGPVSVRIRMPSSHSRWVRPTSVANAWR